MKKLLLVMSLAALPMAYTYADTIGNSSNTMNKESSVPVKTQDDMSTTHKKTTTSGTVHTAPVNETNGYKHQTLDQVPTQKGVQKATDIPTQTDSQRAKQ